MQLEYIYPPFSHGTDPLSMGFLLVEHANLFDSSSPTRVILGSQKYHEL